MKSLSKGLDSLATASKSLLSLYNPIVVINDWGVSIITLWRISPEPVIKEGFVE